MSMRIECFTTAFSYGDFLAEACKFNAGLFDRWVVATSPDDEETRQVCRKYGLECLLTKEHKKYGADFNKGHVVERLLQHASMDSWRCHLDADIVLPANFRRMLEQAHLDESKIYGCDRIMVRSWEDWQKLLSKGWWNGMNSNPYCTIFPQGYDVGARWVSPEASYCPIGFMQLWSGASDEWWGTRVKTYPQYHGNACRSDIKLALKFDRRHRELLPELIVAHLESEPSVNGTNWKGRKTKRFGPSVKAYNDDQGNSKSSDCIS